MIMSEKEFADFLKAHPDLHFNEQTNHAKHIKPANIVDELTKRQRKNKYNNIKVYEDEFGCIADCKENLKGKCIRVYDSTKEFKRWCELSIMQEAGEISNLNRQVSLIIQEAFIYEGKRISAITYKADFVYQKNNKEIIEDVKPFDEEKGKYLTTKDFNLKWKLLKAKYPEKSFALY